MFSEMKIAICTLSDHISLALHQKYSSSYDAIPLQYYISTFISLSHICSQSVVTSNVLFLPHHSEAVNFKKFRVWQHFCGCSVSCSSQITRLWCGNFHWPALNKICWRPMYESYVELQEKELCRPFVWGEGMFVLPWGNVVPPCCVFQWCALYISRCDSTHIFEAFTCCYATDCLDVMHSSWRI